MAENASFDVLVDKIRPAVFAVGDDKKKGKERHDGIQSQLTIRRYISAICGAGTPEPIPIKFDMLVSLLGVIKISNFCNIIFKGFRSRVKFSIFPLTAGHCCKIPRSL